MKRTDMLKLMSKAYGSKNYVYFTEEDADNVLKAMEAVGILPPRVEGIMEETINELEDGGYSYNEWEEVLLKDKNFKRTLNHIKSESKK